MDPLAEVCRIRMLGNDFYKNGHYLQATKKYEEAINILIQFHYMGNFQKDMAVLFCNRANSLFKLGKYQEAFLSAQQSLTIDTFHVKAYYRAGCCMLKLNQTDTALMMFLNGLLHGTSQPEIIADFLTEILVVFEVGGANHAFLANFEYILREQYSKHIWKTVIKRLVQRGMYKACLFLMSTELSRGISDLQVSLKGIFETFLNPLYYRDMSLIHGLVMWLLTMGADVDTIGKYPLHSILKLCIQAGDYNLLELVLRKTSAMKNQINQKDENGNTLLHIVASSPVSMHYTMKRQAQNVKILLDYGCDPGITNREGLDVSAVIKKNRNFKAESIINKHTEKQRPFASEPTRPSDKHEAAALEDEPASFASALEQFVDFCEQNSTQTDQITKLLKHNTVTHFLQVLSTVKEIPAKLTCDIPESFIQGLIDQLISQEKWHEILLLLTRNATGETKDAHQGLFKKCRLPNVNIGSVIGCVDPTSKIRLPLVKILLDKGAPPNGIGADLEEPIQTCLKKNDFALAYLLLSRGGNPQSLTIKDGDMPIHTAVAVALNKNGDDGIRMLKHLLDLYSSDPFEYSYLDPNKQDKNGDTVMHLLFRSDYSKQYQQLMDFLAKFDIKLTIKNKMGKDAKHRIKNKDPRFIAWTEAKKRIKRDQPSMSAKSMASKKIPSFTPGTNSPTPKILHQAQKHQDNTLQNNLSVNEHALDDRFSETVVLTEKPMTLRENLAQAIRDLIKSMELGKLSSEADAPSPTLPLNMNIIDNINLPIAYTHDTTAPTNDLGENTCAEINGAAEFSGNEHCVLYNNEKPTEILETDLDLSKIDFNNMTWEIECAPEALKKLGSKVIPQYMKSKIIHSILKLGNGEWTRSLCKRLKCTKCDIMLYEVKLDKGARLLWELAIDFSPRCSKEPEEIMSEFSFHDSGKTGRVYTEIIRIWDIVLDHCKLSNTIEYVCSSYSRGLSCILRKKLKVLTKTLVSSNVENRIPNYFVEYIELETNTQHIIPDYFPPASAVETEYNIMKFHSFSTDMALNILSNINSRVEYPFRVGELEYAVIDLNPQPLEAIILIGRSGTGKTTCCMYRLWKKFHSYWEKAEAVGEPLLVKQTWQRKKYEDFTEKDETGEEDTTETESSDSTDEEQMPLPGDIAEDISSPECKEDETVKLEHYHPIFITKNNVLCREIQRNFLELSKSTKATSHFKPVEHNIYKLQDLKDENFPMFITSQQLLLLLDASMPDPFFPRNEDGSLKRNINGWSLSDEFDIPDVLRQDDEGDADQEIDEEENICELQENDPRAFVTFELFTSLFWPKMVRGKSLYNAALIWKEIKSFLKGSFEALNCHQGKLTEDLYIKLGRKRAPNFQGDRKEIYRLFCLYEQLKSERGYFDEEDLLYDLSRRLSNLEELPWSIHELYGDEIQDFTQAELFLLMTCINDPNSMFLTGDTAQSIMRGVSFRFSDLRSLFYYASKNCGSGEKNSIVRKPKQIYQLYQNYRSHSGILLLASGIVDLLQYYFPESFDRLPRDCGLFDGPKPTILESCSVSDMAMLLRGNKRKTQPIEFGAHQVILVKNEEAKENIPEELSLALVLTIYESKGLEFDDVLLYNFFTDSEASKEWRIISSFSPVSQETEDRQTIIEVSLDKMFISSIRQEGINPEMHKLLNEELKQLYTAITRARVNLWIFDENQEKRAPAFQYFIKRNLVKVVRTDENKDLDDKMFVRTSSKEEWISQGDYYAKHKCWKVAAKCYQKGGAKDKEHLAFANDAVLNLQSRKTNARDKVEYIRLAKTYLQCGESKLALKCLTWAKEYRLCAELCEKLKKTKDAGYFYKRIQEYKLAAQCFEKAGEFELAMDLYIKEKMFEEAAEVVERCEKNNPNIHQSYTSKQLYLEAAAEYFNNNKLKKMLEILSKIDVEDQLLFLRTHKRWAEAADLLKSKGRCDEAASLMRQHGKLLEAADLTMKREFRASCLLAAARCMIAESKDASNILTEAIQLFKDTENRIGVAEAMLLQGILESDCEKLHHSFQDFMSLSHTAGSVEALYQCVKCGDPDPSPLFIVSNVLNSLLRLVKALRETKNNLEREMVKSCYEFFGIVKVEENNCFIPQYEGARIVEVKIEENFEIRDKKTKDAMYCIELKDVKLMLEKHILKRLYDISSNVFDRVYPDICPKYIAGLECADENCSDFHRPLLRHELKEMIHNKMDLISISGLLLEGRNFAQELSHLFQEKLNVYAFRFCSSLLKLYFPKHFHLRSVSENTVARKIFEEKRHKSQPSYRAMLSEYVVSLFQHGDDRTRRESTDHWLQAMQILTLFSNYPDGLKRFLVKEETQYHKDCLLQSKRKLLDGKHGMLKADASSGPPEGTHIHFFRLLQNAVDQLYINQNPENCKTYFYRFMNVFVKKCTEPLIPNIGNTVMLLEYQFVLCCAVLMRFSMDTRVLLPKSYISILHHWEFMFGRKMSKSGVKDTYSILWEFKTRDVRQTTRNFRHHLFYLAAVLCGEENEQFNVLLDAFSDVDYISSGEAERTLVLCLVMMVNTKGVLDPKANYILCKHFSSIQKSLMDMKKLFPSKVSNRIVNVVDRVTVPVNVEKVVNILQELLVLRDDERLVECSWSWDKGQVRGIYFNDKFNFKKFAHVKHSVTDIKMAHVQEDREIFNEEKVDLVSAIASQVQQELSAMLKFEKLLLLVCFCIKWKRACLRMKVRRMEETIPENFKRAYVDRTQCDLCGVKFLQSGSVTSLPEETEEGISEAVTPIVWAKDDIVGNTQEVGETYEIHITKENHKNQKRAYNNYLKFYKEKVERVLCESKSLLKTMEETTGHELTKEVFRLEQNKTENKIKKIVDLMERIYETKTWCEADMSMEIPLTELSAGILHAQELLRKNEQHLSKKEGFPKDDMFEHEVDYGGFEELCCKKSKKNKRRFKKH
ncbi:TPR and ankyrin repeat-containing protein 1 [Spea bombifrons]|uniref:TPR and ankyrin repeat-containing protein 1 n=1 Tax=Spea bombifrons TaxID=233779 RepID=UPI0023493E83|nr:TPR and ankyrin repeat-containing protein 1 [Spea bombifrons]